MKRILGLAFGNTVANTFMVVGAVLLVLALHFGVNPADGSVVDASVRGTWIPIFLFIATLPAMAAMFLTGGGPISLGLMYLAQICVYWALGRGISYLFSTITKDRTNPHDQ